jgi:hypothetical protein
VQSLCESCRLVRVILSGRGSQFLLCQKSQEDERFAKYPPQPVVRCGGYEAASADSIDLPGGASPTGTVGPH